MTKKLSSGDLRNLVEILRSIGKNDAADEIAADIPDEPPPFKKFTITCASCQSKDIQVSYHASMGSEETGLYDEEITLRCRRCGATDTKDKD